MPIVRLIANEMNAIIERFFLHIESFKQLTVYKIRTPRNKTKWLNMQLILTAVKPLRYNNIICV